MSTLINLNDCVKEINGGQGYYLRTETGRKVLFLQKTFKQGGWEEANKEIAFTVKHARFVVSFETNSKS